MREDAATVVVDTVRREASGSGDAVGHLASLLDEGAGKRARERWDRWRPAELAAALAPVIVDLLPNRKTVAIRMKESAVVL